MKDITVYYSEAGNIPPQSVRTIQALCRTNKDFDYASYNAIAIVHTNNVDIGLVGINITEAREMTVNIFQTPNVCRMSILSLIDASIYFAQSLAQPEDVVIFKNVHYAHTFKLKQIISDIIANEDDYYTSGVKLLSVDMSQISLKNILLEKI